MAPTAHRRSLVLKRHGHPGPWSRHRHALGWLTLIGAGTVFSAALAAVSSVTPTVSVAIGFITACAAARVLDRYHWPQVTFGESNSHLSTDQARAIVERLQANGHDVSLELRPQGVLADDQPVEWSIRPANS